MLGITTVEPSLVSEYLVSRPAPLTGKRTYSLHCSNPLKNEDTTGISFNKVFCQAMEVPYTIDCITSVRITNEPQIKLETQHSERIGA